MRGLPSPIIKDIKVITTQPSGVRLVVVKIFTDQDGLYGYGCATFTQRADLVTPAVEKYLKPLLLGKPADRIEDTWQACYNSSYWRNGPVLNNAISGVDQALWDIKGRQANMPVYQLLGGKAREAALTYATVGATEIPEVIDRTRALHGPGISVHQSSGWRSRYGRLCGRRRCPRARLALRARCSNPFRTCAARGKCSKSAASSWARKSELIHDVHERVTPHQAVQFAKELEPIRLFYLEDVLSPEDIAYFRLIRQQCSTSLAMGELFNSPHEWQPLIVRAPD